MYYQKELSVMAKQEDVSPTERAFIVLEMLAMNGSVSASDLVTALKVPKTTAHRLIGNLEEIGFVHRSMERSRYQAAPRLLDMAAGVVQSALRQVAVHTVLEDVMLRLQESCCLTVMRGEEMIMMDCVMPASPLKLVFERGKSFPLYCTPSGRIWLAHMDKRTLENYFTSGPWHRFTAYTVIDPVRLAEEVQTIKALGYSVVESEYYVGVVGMSVPIYNQSGKLLACLSIAAPTARKAVSDILEAIPLLQAASRKIGRILAYKQQELLPQCEGL